MAKEKTQIDVELARIKADVDRTKARCETVSWGIVCLAVVIAIGIIAWAAVRMTDKPPWLTLILAFLGSAGAPSLVAWRLWVRVARFSAKVEPPPADCDAESATRESGEQT